MIPVGTGVKRYRTMELNTDESISDPNWLILKRLPIVPLEAFFNVSGQHTELSPIEDVCMIKIIKP